MLNLLRLPVLFLVCLIIHEVFQLVSWLKTGAKPRRPEIPASRITLFFNPPLFVRCPTLTS
jgi:hypothetical protein